jgi:flagellar biogenesis protein FliO
LPAVNYIFTGRGHIKRLSLILVIIFIINFSFQIFSIDATSDKNLTEKEYLKKIKTLMDSEKKDKGADAEKNKQNRPKIKIDYFSYIKVIFVLGIVILIIYGISIFLKKSLKIKGQIGENAVIIQSQVIGPGKWLQIVYIAGKYLLLGITNDNINLLSEITDPKEIERFEVILNERKVTEGTNFIDTVTDFIKNKFKFKFDKGKFDYEEDSIDFLNKQKDRINKLKNKK